MPRSARTVDCNQGYERKIFINLLSSISRVGVAHGPNQAIL